MRDDLFVYGRDSMKARTHFSTEQGSRCAICGTAGTFLAVDHEHSDKALCRGLLCGNCNLALGLLKDSRDVMGAAIAYLDAHDARNEAYEATGDWEERRVKVTNRPPQATTSLSDFDRKKRNAAIRQAINAGGPPDAVAVDFSLSTRMVREIAYGR